MNNVLYLIRFDGVEGIWALFPTHVAVKLRHEWDTRLIYRGMIGGLDIRVSHPSR